MSQTSQEKKYDSLIKNLCSMQNVLVAFSGGVDSSLLLHAAHQALSENVLAVTFSTPYSPKVEILEAENMAQAMRVNHQVIELPIPEEIRENPPERCYLCKKNLFGLLLKIAAEKGIKHILDGSNVDDLSDYRPGSKAVQELGVESPLLDAGMTKQDIRDLSKKYNLSTWDKVAGACLLTRIPHGSVIEEAELRRIDDGETFLKSIGFSSVRLRSHGKLARIEVPVEAIADFCGSSKRHKVTAVLMELGYRYITLDLAGYHMGSLNEPAK